jgi:hypothetical protein
MQDNFGRRSNGGEGFGFGWVDSWRATVVCYGFYGLNVF